MVQEGNRLTRLMLEDENTDIKTALKTVSAKLTPSTVNVTEDEVKGFAKVSDGDKVLVADCMTEGKEAESLLPAYHKVADVRTSDALHDQLYELEDQIFELYIHVRRNRMLAGSESLNWVSTFYALIKTAATAKNKMPAAVAMFKRLEGYYLKKVEASKAKKKKEEADKKKAEEERAAEKAALAAEKAALAAEKAELAAQKAA